MRQPCVLPDLFLLLQSSTLYSRLASRSRALCFAGVSATVVGYAVKERYVESLMLF